MDFKMILSNDLNENSPRKCSFNLPLNITSFKHQKIYIPLLQQFYFIPKTKTQTQYNT